MTLTWQPATLFHRESPFGYVSETYCLIVCRRFCVLNAEYVKELAWERVSEHLLKCFRNYARFYVLNMSLSASLEEKMSNLVCFLLFYCKFAYMPLCVGLCVFLSAHVCKNGNVLLICKRERMCVCLHEYMGIFTCNDVCKRDWNCLYVNYYVDMDIHICHCD